MPFYYYLDGRKPEDKKIADGILRLKNGFTEEKFPGRTVDDTLLLATWNIREFESGKYGLRDKESIFYIAEVITRFDIVAVQEVRDDLSSLNLLMKYLGGWWKYLLTGVTEGTMGNRERMAFIYDSRKINFGGFASEIVVPPVKRKGKPDLEPSNQLARTPFMVGFRAGWFKFTICTTHILYGESVAEDPNRIKEIEVLAKFLAERASEPYAWSKNMIMLGDFNVFDTTNKTLTAITDQGFVIPKQILNTPSNALRNKHFDQIAFITPDIRQDQLELCSAGVFDFYKYVYRLEDEELYAAAMGDPYAKDKDGKKRDEKARARYYKEWRTFQMSDHLPLWIELKIDFSKDYLKSKVEENAGPTRTFDPMAPTPTREELISLEQIDQAGE
ncbi:MAG TPA: endonuclease/exonuclease/phosphatase family protein [Pyrinomonadaceae bacterium]|jgi:endonuclease/exonuclease/phosphatase family metal-dependent hydrolase|nr:endonuclease/exonuclease/phosphatase family protein [Pyrinomonadaceae bacterium]